MKAASGAVQKEAFDLLLLLSKFYFPLRTFRAALGVIVIHGGCEDHRHFLLFPEYGRCILPD
jgi:hypothetical protein